MDPSHRTYKYKNEYIYVCIENYQVTGRSPTKLHVVRSFDDFWSEWSAWCTALAVWSWVPQFHRSHLIPRHVEKEQLPSHWFWGIKGSPISHTQCCLILIAMVTYLRSQSTILSPRPPALCQSNPELQHDKKMYKCSKTSSINPFYSKNVEILSSIECVLSGSCCRNLKNH